ncbi:MAG TPA: hypothetical protein VJR29_01295 [bacterium]|nr:hypothetical protein [bacterium]
MTLEAPTHRRLLAGDPLDRALNGLSGSALAERRSLERERDPFLYMEGLLTLAGRLERDQRPELASRIYAQMLESAEAPPELRDRARRRLAAWNGEGEVGDRAEVLLSRFSRELTDPVSLFAMTAAGAAFRTARFVSLARLAANPAAGALSRGFGARILSHAAGFVSEALVFPLAARLGNLTLGRDQAWSGSAWARETASSFLLLGALRAGGLLAGLAGRRTLLGPLGQQAGMFGGILLGHELETRFGLRERTRGSITLLDSLAMLLQFNAAGRIQRGLTGEGWRNWERSLEAQTAVLERGGGRDLRPPWSKAGILPEPLVAGAALASSRGVEPLRGPDRVYMSQGGEGGGQRSAAEVLIRAASLRVRIAPPEAWARRENLTRDYLELLAQLPVGQTKTLEEIQLGVEMLGTWAASRDPFLVAIGHRFYAPAWRIFRDKFSHVESHFELEQRIVNNVLLHRQLISEGNNGSFLRQAVQASPAIASLLLHQRMALGEGSTRDLHLLDALHQVLTTLHLGAELLPEPALRKAYLEAWHDSLQAVHATGELAAREVLSGIRMLRQYLTDADPARRDLAAFHYPNFWKLFRTVTRTNSLQGLDFGLSEEVAFLQQNRDLKTPPPVLETVLKAYPHYVDAVIGLHQHHLVELATMVDLFAGLGRQFRGSIELAKDPRIRAHFVEAYVEMLRSCQEASRDLEPWVHGFPRNVPQAVIGEMREGLALLRQGWITEQGDFQVRAFDQYWRLAERYPVSEGLADQVSSGPYLKPLSLLAGFNPNMEVRQAAQTLLQRLLDRFRPDAPRH